MKITPLFENELVNVFHLVMDPWEEVGLHRDAVPSIVTATKSGTVTRLEADGTETAVHFPLNIPVFRPVDPENELHRSVNRSNESVELTIIQLKETAKP